VRKTPIFVLVLISATMIPAIQRIHAAAETVDGFVSDTMCGKKHMMPGKTDAQCIQECVKSGRSYALVPGDKVYTLAGKTQAIAPFAGKHVKIEDGFRDNTITVTSIHEGNAQMSNRMPM